MYEVLVLSLFSYHVESKISLYLTHIGMMTLCLCAMIPILHWLKIWLGGNVRVNSTSSTDASWGIPRSILHRIQYSIAGVMLLFMQPMNGSFSRKILVFLPIILAIVPLLHVWFLLPLPQGIQPAIPLILSLAFLALHALSFGVMGLLAFNHGEAIIAMRQAVLRLSLVILLGFSALPIVRISSSQILYDLMISQHDTIYAWLPLWGVMLVPLNTLVCIAATAAWFVQIQQDFSPHHLMKSPLVNLSGLHRFGYQCALYLDIIVTAAWIATLFFGGAKTPTLTESVPNMAPILLIFKTVFVAGMIFFMQRFWLLHSFHKKLSWIWLVALPCVVVSSMLLEMSKFFYP